jgi:RNA polymerase sigma factor (TIGR02999 family)
VHEAFLKLVNQDRVDWQGRTHFFAVGAQVMRRILVDHARNRQRQKRGGGMPRIELSDDLTLSNRRDEDVLAVDQALSDLAEVDAIQAKIVELRFFGGLTVAEVAKTMQMSKRTVESEWAMARAWLRRELSRDGDGDGDGDSST